MKLTTDIIDQLAEALMMKNKKGEEIWEDGDNIEVCIAGTFAGDKFITLLNRTKNPVISSVPPSTEIFSQYMDHEEGS